MSGFRAHSASCRLKRSIFHHINFPSWCIINERCGLLMKGDEKGEMEPDPQSLPATVSAARSSALAS